MTGEERRMKILNAIKIAKSPISGTTLAKQYHVSRQVVVQDIALLRAAKHDVFSTPKGYLIHRPEAVTRVMRISHTDAQIEDELNTIVDIGGRVVDVFIEHETYGAIRANLFITSRRNVKDFLEKIENGQSSPLKNLTSGKHCHTVEADSEELLDLIQEELKKKGYLL